MATDLAAAKDFYASKVGLKIISDNPGAVTFKAGGESQLSITKSTTGTRDEQTQAAFLVKDVCAEVAELRSRGVKFEDYDTPDLKTVEGVADLGFAMMAWFIDPAKNCVGILQLT